MLLLKKTIPRKKLKEKVASEQPKQDKNLYYPDEPNKPIKEGLRSNVLFESPFTSVLKSPTTHLSLSCSLDRVT
jgi:hypothetical protein